MYDPQGGTPSRAPGAPAHPAASGSQPFVSRPESGTSDRLTSRLAYPTTMSREADGRHNPTIGIQHGVAAVHIDHSPAHHVAGLVAREPPLPGCSNCRRPTIRSRLESSPHCPITPSPRYRSRPMGTFFRLPQPPEARRRKPSTREPAQSPWPTSADAQSSSRMVDAPPEKHPTIPKNNCCSSGYCVADARFGFSTNRATGWPVNPPYFQNAIRRFG